MSFVWLCHCCLGLGARQVKCRSTALPHTQTCGSHACYPSRRTTAILVISPDSLRSVETISYMVDVAVSDKGSRTLQPQDTSAPQKWCRSLRRITGGAVSHRHCPGSKCPGFSSITALVSKCLEIGAEVSQSVLMPKCLVAEVSGNRDKNVIGEIASSVPA